MKHLPLAKNWSDEAFNALSHRFIASSLLLPSFGPPTSRVDCCFHDSSLGGLLDWSKAQYFYKGSQKSLHKLIFIFWSSIFNRKHVFKYYWKLLYFKYLYKRNMNNIICICYHKMVLFQNVHYITSWWLKNLFQIIKEILCFLWRGYYNCNLTCFCSVDI